MIPGAPDWRSQPQQPSAGDATHAPPPPRACVGGDAADAAPEARGVPARKMRQPRVASRTAFMHEAAGRQTFYFRGGDRCDLAAEACGARCRRPPQALCRRLRTVSAPDRLNNAAVAIGTAAIGDVAQPRRPVRQRQPMACA